MSTFSGTVYYYQKYRPGIPDEVADILDRAAPAGKPRRLLDLGTGTGMVIQALLGRFDDIIGVDTDSDMLTVAEDTLLPRLPAGTTLLFQKQAAETFVPPNAWNASLVTICRAFHWLDQAAVLQRLSNHVAPDGAVAIFGDSSFWTATSPWKDAVRTVVQQFLGEKRRAGSGVFSHHDRPYTEVLAESPFADVTEMTVPVRRVWSAESILGYLYSTSFAAPPLFGPRLGEFEATMAETLLEFSNNDTYLEDNVFVIRIGRRRRH